MARHQGTYKPDKAEIPFELSRSKIEDFIKCKACFWLEKVRGVKRPAIPGFNINTNTDTLLKRDFDSVRGEESHPFLINNGLGHLIPFDHDNLELWTQSMHFGLPDRFNTLHKETNILFGGGIDDIYQNKETGELHVVDYKSTANLSKNPTRVSLEGKWKEGYKRQADMYTWVLRRKGFAVSDTAYFVYVDGLHIGYKGMIDDDTSLATMKFETTLLSYLTDTSWIEPALIKIKDLLSTPKCPEHSWHCEYGIYLKQATEATS